MPGRDVYFSENEYFCTCPLSTNLLCASATAGQPGETEEQRLNIVRFTKEPDLFS